MTTETYRTRSVVRAFRFTEELVWALIEKRSTLPWGLAPSLCYHQGDHVIRSATITLRPRTKTCNGVHVNLGDWVVRDERGDMVPMCDDYFRSHFDVVKTIV